MADVFAEVFGASDDDDGSDFEGFAIDEIGVNVVDDSDDDIDAGMDVMSVLDGGDSDDGGDADGESDGDDDSDADTEWSKDLHSSPARAFSGPAPGPTTKLNGEASVLDFFFLIFPLTLIRCCNYN